MLIEESPEERRRVLAAQIEEILRRVAICLSSITGPPDEILGYDEHGLPR